MGKNKMLLLMSALIGFASALFSVPAHAAKPQRPSTPVIAAVLMQKKTGKDYSYKVIIDRNSSAGTAASVRIETSSGQKCSIAPRASTCVLSKIRLRTNYDNFGIRAQASSAGRVSSWTRWMYVGTGGGSYVRIGYDSRGVKFPDAVVSATLKWKTLGTASKWTKFQALKRSNVSSASTRPFRLPRVVSCGTYGPNLGPATTTTTAAGATNGDPCVVFQVNGIVGLAFATASTSCGSNAACALAVASNGTTSGLYIPGSDTPTVKDFYAAPNGKMYVVFSPGARLVVGGPTCVFVEVNADTGVPTCIDKDVTSIQTTMGSAYGLTNNGNPPVQFDAAGNVYYSGMAAGSTVAAPLTLREYSNGTVRTIINDNISLTDFVVMADGDVLLSGVTSSTQAAWVRKVSASGQISNIATGSRATFLRQFADGNVYFGYPSSMSTMPMVMRYLSSTGAIDPTPWITSMNGGPQGSIQGTSDTSMLCATFKQPTTGPFCSSAGAYALNFFNFGSTRTIGIAGSVGGTGGSQLVQYWPTIEAQNTTVSNVTIAYRVNNKLLLTGTNANGKNVLTMYDPETKQEEFILDGSNEVEIYSVGYVPATNKIMFNGLQFSDGKYVVAEVALG